MSDKMGGKEATFFGSVRRFARTSGAVGGIAARVAGERVFGFKTDRAAHAEDLRQVLGGLKGPLMKVAQILTTIPDALPPEYAAELSELQANAPSMGWPFVRRRMAGELGPDWQSRFRSFDQEAAAAASLGQVHKAVLHDGETVACKLQYPDMPSTVEADLRQLKIAMAIYHRMDNAIQHDEIYKELSERLREELDYLREAAQMRLYQAMLAPVADIHVPTPVVDLTTSRLLTMSWLDGGPLQRWLDTEPPLEARNRVAEALFRAWYVPFYQYGIIHGDPHLGNYQVRPDGGVNLLDFGAIRVFPPSFVRGVIDLFEAVRDADEGRAADAYRNWGFDDVTPEKVRVLNGWARFLYEPLLDNRVRRIQENGEGNFGRAVAEEVHSGLKSIGGVRPPREFVLMDRSAVGLGSVFLRLKAELNWSELYREVTAGFDEAALAERQAAALAAAGVPPPK